MASELLLNLRRGGQSVPVPVQEPTGSRKDRMICWVAVIGTLPRGRILPGLIEPVARSAFYISSGRTFGWPKL